MAHGNVDPVDADARLLDVRPSAVTVICFQEGLNGVSRQDRDLRWYICRMNEDPVRDRGESQSRGGFVSQ